MHWIGLRPWVWIFNWTRMETILESTIFLSCAADRPWSNAYIRAPMERAFILRHCMLLTVAFNGLTGLF